MILNFILQATEGIDTTGTQYQIGYKIGTYLPVTIILVIAFFVIKKQYRK